MRFGGSTKMQKRQPRRSRFEEKFTYHEPSSRPATLHYLASGYAHNYSLPAQRPTDTHFLQYRVEMLAPRSEAFVAKRTLSYVPRPGEGDKDEREGTLPHGVYASQVVEIATTIRGDEPLPIRWQE